MTSIRLVKTGRGIALLVGVFKYDVPRELAVEAAGAFSTAAAMKPEEFFDARLEFDSDKGRYAVRRVQ